MNLFFNEVIFTISVELPFLYHPLVSELHNVNLMKIA